MLAGVSRVIARRGVEETRFSDVVRETGAALSTLQYRFGSWEGMIVAALHEANRIELQRVSAAMAEADGTVDALRRCVIATMRASSPPDEARAGWLTWMESWRAAARDDRLAADWRAIHDEWRALIEPVLTRGEREGVFVLADGAAAAAIQVLSLIDGLSVPLVLGHGDATTERAGRLALRGVSALVGCPQLAEPTKA